MIFRMLSDGFQCVLKAPRGVNKAFSRRWGHKTGFLRRRQSGTRNISLGAGDQLQYFLAEHAGLPHRPLEQPLKEHALQVQTLKDRKSSFSESTV